MGVGSITAGSAGVGAGSAVGAGVVSTEPTTTVVSTEGVDVSGFAQIAVKADARPHTRWKCPTGDKQPTSSTLHIVEKGENLTSIGEESHVTAREIFNANCVANNVVIQPVFDPNLVYTGQKLVVPGDTVAEQAPAASSVTREGFSVGRHGNGGVVESYKKEVVSDTVAVATIPPTTVAESTTPSLNFPHGPRYEGPANLRVKEAPQVADVTTGPSTTLSSGFSHGPRGSFKSESSLREVSVADVTTPPSPVVAESTTLSLNFPHGPNAETISLNKIASQNALYEHGHLKRE